MIVNESQLYRDLARATGESVGLIRQIGFSLVTPHKSQPDDADRWLRGSRHRRRGMNSHRQRSRQPVVTA
jgi:hypothetical protein